MAQSVHALRKPPELYSKSRIDPHRTRGLRQPLTMKIEEETLAEEGTPVPHIKHGEE